MKQTLRERTALRMRKYNNISRIAEVFKKTACKNKYLLIKRKMVKNSCLSMKKKKIILLMRAGMEKSLSIMAPRC